MHFVCVVGRPGGKTNDFPLSQHFECVDGSPGNNSGDIALSQHLARVVGSPGEKIREFALFQKAKAKVHPSIHPSIHLFVVCSPKAGFWASPPSFSASSRKDHAE